MRIKLLPPPGHAFVRDWAGKRVRTQRELRNGWCSIPEGAIGTIQELRGGTGLTIKLDACRCCGVNVYMTGLHDRDVELVS